MKGKSRSVFVITCYLMKYENYKYENALKHIGSKKPDVNISPIFIDQLKAYQNNNSDNSDNIINALIDRIKEYIKINNTNLNITDEFIKNLICKYKKIKTIEKCILDNRSLDYYNHTIYNITISKKSNFIKKQIPQ